MTAGDKVSSIEMSNLEEVCTSQAAQIESLEEAVEEGLARQAKLQEEIVEKQKELTQHEKQCTEFERAIDALETENALLQVKK